MAQTRGPWISTATMNLLRRTTDYAACSYRKMIGKRLIIWLIAFSGMIVGEAENNLDFISTRLTKLFLIVPKILLCKHLPQESVTDYLSSKIFKVHIHLITIIHLYIPSLSFLPLSTTILLIPVGLNAVYPQASSATSPCNFLKQLLIATDHPPLTCRTSIQKICLLIRNTATL